MLHITHETQHINTLRIGFDMQHIKRTDGLNGEQIKAARTMLGLTAHELAEAAGVSVPTLQRMDSARGPVPGRYETVQKVKAVLEAEGIQFLDSGDVAAGPGVAMEGARSQRVTST